MYTNRVSDIGISMSTITLQRRHYCCFTSDDCKSVHEKLKPHKTHKRLKPVKELNIHFISFLTHIWIVFTWVTIISSRCMYATWENYFLPKMPTRLICILASHFMVNNSCFFFFFIILKKFHLLFRNLQL